MFFKRSKTLFMGFPEFSSQSCAHSHLNLEHQRLLVEAERRRSHQEWCESHTNKQRFDHKASLIRAQFLVHEAYRLEKEHLKHQEVYCRTLILKQENDVSSPPRIRCESNVMTDCPCLRAPVYRQLPPKFRAMNLLQPHFANCDLENTIDTLRETYDNDHEMMDDLLNRYGPEEPEVDPKIWMKSIIWRKVNLAPKWKGIFEAVKAEFRYRDNFSNVIRNLSIMRIFLEGSQAPTYSCDSTERLRRDAFHQAVLEEVQRRGTLFIE